MASFPVLGVAPDLPISERLVQRQVASELSRASDVAASTPLLTPSTEAGALAGVPCVVGHFSGSFGGSGVLPSLGSPRAATLAALFVQPGARLSLLEEPRPLVSAAAGAAEG
mmetsp:Transcript_15820/g.27486  ORF Transcript_15820/g.27486 Transcript_15820/m.27486 type:complete len:112 (-) Transcript_15820:50-385(-)